MKPGCGPYLACFFFVTGIKACFFMVTSFSLDMFKSQAMGNCTKIFVKSLLIRCLLTDTYFHYWFKHVEANLHTDTKFPTYHLFFPRTHFFTLYTFPCFFLAAFFISLLSPSFSVHLRLSFPSFYPIISLSSFLFRYFLSLFILAFSVSSFLLLSLDASQSLETF